MRTLISLTLLIVLLTGCAPWIGMHKIDLGMQKTEVLQQMGTPNSVSGSGNEEYLYYVPVNRFWERYYVFLINGKVEAYGRLGAQNEPAR